MRGAGAEEPALDRLTLTLEVTLRRCVAEDLPLLEWGGMFTAHRELIAAAWCRHRAGEDVMLVAEAQRFPIGQIWVDLTRKGTQSIGLLQNNLEARRLYERCGYQVVAEELNAYEYTTPEGQLVRMAAPQWILHKTLTAGQERSAP